MLKFTINFKFKKWILLVVLCSLQCLSVAQEPNEVIIPGMYKMPLKQGQKTENVASTAAVREDLHKFMGYELLLARYLSIPYDVSINSNVSIFFTDVGFLLLLLLPMLFLFPQTNNRQRKTRYQTGLNLAMIGLYSLLLIVSISSAYLNKHQLYNPKQGLIHLTTLPETDFLASSSKTINQSAMYLYTPIHKVFTSISGQQDGITYPLLMLLFAALLVMVMIRLQKHPKRTKTFALFLMVYLFLWWILGSGAAWYGLLLFCVPYIFLVKALQSSTGQQPFSLNLNNLSPSVFKSSMLLFCFAVWLLMAFTFRASNYNPVNKERAKYIYIPPIMEYQTGKINQKKLMGYHFPLHYEIQEIINREDQSLVYRVGTNMNYFIKKNDKRVLNDTFLENFQKLVNRFKTKQKIIEVLKASGYQYIVIDLNMAVNDLTPEKTLTTKFTQLLNTLYDNPAVELLATNRTIKRNSDGKVVNAVFADQGLIVNTGEIALFRIK
ncbi:MAG: hypothetical protein R3E32_29365 [Chitinophagales bacterium]